MRGKLWLVFTLYLTSFIIANLLVKWVGAYGLLISSFLLIPFDFVARCFLHEKWKGRKLITNLLVLTIISGIATVLINRSAMNIALASVAGFTAAQIGAGIFYQCYKHKSYLFKVNLSDIIAIGCDSVVFQLVAFHSFLPTVLAGQAIIKIAGGLMWYYILFRLIKIQQKL